MSSAADDHRVKGGATPPTVAVDTIMSIRKRLASRVRRRATKKWRITFKGRRCTVRVRMATGRGDVLRLVTREERSAGGRRISEMRVWWRWLEVVRVGVDGSGGLNVARGVALRVTAGLSNNVCGLRVQTGVDERHLLEYKGERIRG
jgi:hypothetical protein